MGGGESANVSGCRNWSSTISRLTDFHRVPSGTFLWGVEWNGVSLRHSAWRLALRIGLVGAVLLMSGGVVAALAQGPAAETAATKATLVEMTGLRDSFVKRVQAAGFTCPIAPPRIVVEDVPSFGQCNPETNTLRTSDWTLLNPREHALFVQLAGPGADEEKVRGLFETAAHRWIFIHELGHWVAGVRGREREAKAVGVGVRGEPGVAGVLAGGGPGRW